jgi:hypothetical protein
VTADTEIRLACDSERPVQAPEPRPAHQRRPSAGALTSPTTGSSPSTSAIKVAHTGTPRTKFLVPSIGSITHCRAPCPVTPNSSPSTASRGRVRDSWLRTISSAERSASVTGVVSGFVSTVRSWALKRAMVWPSTWSAMTWASRRSSSYRGRAGGSCMVDTLVQVGAAPGEAAVAETG